MYTFLGVDMATEIGDGRLLTLSSSRQNNCEIQRQTQIFTTIYYYYCNYERTLIVYKNQLMSADVLIHNFPKFSSDLYPKYMIKMLVSFSLIFHSEGFRAQISIYS